MRHLDKVERRKVSQWRNAPAPPPPL